MDKKIAIGIGIGCAISLFIALIAGVAFVAGGAFARWTASPEIRREPISNVDYALQFDGLDDYVDLGNWFNYDTFTLAMWVNPASSQVTYADIIDNNHTDFRSWVIQQDQDNINRYLSGVKDGSSVIYFTLTANTWQHIAVTRSDGVRKVYVNGSLINTATGSSSIVYDGTQILSLARYGWSGRHWKGQMDEVQIWDVALTQQQIQNYIKRRLNGNESGLVAYYRFDEGSSIIAKDSSLHGHDGRLYNNPVWVISSVPK
jgi:hypothetical protein